MRGREFLKLSSILAMISEESAIRTRTGRAYYAAYLEARSFCEEQLEYVRVKQSREHQDIPVLRRSVGPDVVSHLTFLRNIADYELDVSITTVEGSVVQAELLAHEVVVRLDAHAERLERERRPRQDRKASPVGNRYRSVNQIARMEPRSGSPERGLVVLLNG